MKTILPHIFVSAVICALCSSILFAAPFDTGFLIWTQPNNATFTARYWGDEFEWWFETQDGYRISPGAGGWYYYATLDGNGEYTSTSSRVGIDSPPPANSYKLSRSQACINTINQWKAQADSQIARSSAWFAQKQASAGSNPVVLRLGVVFVQFADVSHFNPNIPPRIGGYLKSDFDSMLFSQNYWKGPQENTKHPEGDSIFGSMRDYYYQMSRGKLILTGTLLNPANANGVPRWVTIRNRVNYANVVNLWADAMTAYHDSSIANPGQWPDTSGNDKFVFIYAQDDAGRLGLTHADYVGGRACQVPERMGFQLRSTLDLAFAHIGTYCHEFGHNIGFYDEYNGGTHGYVAGLEECICSDTYDYDLMSTGAYNGPRGKGECPASLSPYYRIQKSWVADTLLQNDASNLKFVYKYQNPIYYRINPVNRDTSLDEFFILETRLRQGFDAYIPTTPESLSAQPGVFLVWHFNRRVIGSLGDDRADRIKIVTADNSLPSIRSLGGFFPRDGIRQSFNDLTLPKASTTLDPNVNPAYEYPGHFALNGIHRHKPINGNDSDYTIIDTVSLNLTMISGILTQNTTWTNNVWIVSDVTVQSGVTLTLLPGTKVVFSPGMALTVNGKLNAAGTSSQRITFTSSSSTPVPGDWAGIVCSGGGPDTLTYCDINYAETGLWLQNTAANSYLQNDTIRYSSSSGSGLNVTNTGTANRSLRMYKCGINNNDGIALKVGNAKVSISYSRIENNGLQWISEGVYVYSGARVFFDSSRIQYNNGTGVRISGTGSRILLTPDSAKTGYNTICQHGVSELSLASSGSAFLGGGYGPGNYGGYNSVYNTYNYNCRLINNGTLNLVSAKWTYWGSAGTRFCGPVDSSLQLGSPVNTPALMKYHHPGDEPMAEIGPSTSLSDWLSQLKSDIGNNSENAFDALHHLANFSGPGGDYQSVVGMPWENYLSTVVNKSALPNVRSLAIGLLVQSSLDKGNFAQAICSADDMLAKTIDDDLRFFLQTRKIYAEVGRGNISSANDVLSEIQSTASLSDTDAVKGMTEYVSLASKSAQGNGALGFFVKNSSAQNHSPNRYILSQNFPNPFNPTTSFRYEIAISGHVSLKIYDVLGREVAMIVDEEKDPGEYNMTWDASSYSSGVYFFKLQAGTFTDVKKMLLVR